MNSKKVLISLAIISILLFGVYSLRLISSIYKNNLYPAKLSNTDINIKIANTPKETSKGLMFVPYMPKNQGMLFVFDRLAMYRFWMAYTLIPLDIIWLDSNLKVISINENVPPCRNYFNVSKCPTYLPLYPANYVLEMNSNFAKENNIKKGDKLLVSKDLLIK